MDENTTPVTEETKEQPAAEAEKPAEAAPATEMAEAAIPEKPDAAPDQPRAEPEAPAAAQEEAKEKPETPAEEKPAATLEDANRLLAAAYTETYAAALGLDAKAVEAAQRMNYLEGCVGKNGLADKEAVKAKIEQFATDWPQFKAAVPAKAEKPKVTPPPPVAAGTGTAETVDSFKQKLGL